MVQRRSLDLSPAILALIQKERLPLGTRLYETRLARHFNVSRAPVRVALQRLAEQGVVQHKTNHGFVLQSVPESPAAAQVEDDDILYMALARDHFDGLLPESCSERKLLSRYGGTVADLRRTLARAAAEGWAERQSGYGWRFLEVLRQPDAYTQLMRLRQALEPLGLLEPTYVRDVSMIERLRQRQLSLLEQGLSSFSVSDLFRDGCEFHETIAAASGNVFLLETLKRFNAMRRLFFYRAIVPNYEHIEAHIHEHLVLLDLMEAGDNVAASSFLHRHLR